MSKSQTKYDRHVPDVAYNLMLRCNGNKKEVAKILGIGYSTFNSWYKNKKEFKEAIDNAEDYRMEHVEQAVFIEAYKGNMTAANILLKSKKSNEYGADKYQKLTTRTNEEIELDELGMDELLEEIQLMNEAIQKRKNGGD